MQIPSQVMVREFRHSFRLALRRKLEKRGYHVSLYTYSPGTRFPDHRHDVDKIDAVLSGRFRMKMGGRAVILEAGDCLVVPRGTVHSAEVVALQYGGSPP